MKEFVPGTGHGHGHVHKHVYKSCITESKDQYVLVLQRIEKQQQPNDVDSLDDTLEYLPQCGKIHSDQTFEKNGQTFDYPTWTITNESRFAIRDPMHAKFRGTAFLVLAIINKQTGECVDSIIAISICNIHTLYQVGRIIVPNLYDCQIDQVCAPGIHFFNDFETAYFYQLDPISTKYTGPIKRYYDDGAIQMIGQYKDGTLNGPTMCIDRGLISKGNRSDGVKTGRWIETCQYINMISIKQYDANGNLQERALVRKSDSDHNELTQMVKNTNPGSEEWDKLIQMIQNAKSIRDQDESLGPKFSPNLSPSVRKKY